MTISRFARFFAAFIIMLAVPAGSLRATPDDTLGVALMSASVDGENPPNLIRGSGAVSVTRIAEGIFNIVFSRSVANCSCTASAGDFVVGNQRSAFTATANCPYNASSVRVVTSYHDGSTSSSPFHVIVFCPK